jgi:hypothetical protein
MNMTFAVSSNTWQTLRAKAPYLTLKLKAECQTNPPPDKWHMECPAWNSRKFRWLKIQKRSRTPPVKYELQNVEFSIATSVWHNISFTERRFNPMKCNLIWISRTSKDSILCKHKYRIYLRHDCGNRSSLRNRRWNRIHWKIRETKSNAQVIK